jgi:hypothetical protein
MNATRPPGVQPQEITMGRRLALTTLGFVSLFSAETVMAAPGSDTPDFSAVRMQLEVQDLSTGATVKGSYGSELDWVAVLDSETGRLNYELRSAPGALQAGGGSWARFDQGTYFDPDPVLLLAGSAVNNGTSALLYTFSFNAPMSPALTGLINSSAVLGVTLTDGGTDGASLTPFGSDLYMLESVDFFGSGASFGQLSKNVDVGTALQVFAGAVSPITAQTFNKSGTLTCVIACTTMSARMSFVLSPGDAMSFSGRITQDVAPVPVPAAFWLLCSGLGALGAAARRRSTSRRV